MHPTTHMELYLSDDRITETELIRCRPPFVILNLCSYKQEESSFILLTWPVPTPLYTLTQKSRPRNERYLPNPILK